MELLAKETKTICAHKATAIIMEGQNGHFHTLALKIETPLAPKMVNFTVEYSSAENDTAQDIFSNLVLDMDKCLEPINRRARAHYSVDPWPAPTAWEDLQQACCAALGAAIGDVLYQV